jgi:glycosyltransferase involved in cell wall biosynthesis
VTSPLTSVGVVIASEHAGGAEGYLLDLYRGLRPLGVAGTLLGSLPGWEQTGCPQVPVGLGGKWTRRNLPRVVTRTPIEVTGALVRIRAAHRTRRFDRFHAQFKREQLLLTPALARMAPVVWTEHGRFSTFRGSDLLRRGYRLAARSVETIVCVSDEVADEVSAIVGPRVAVEVIENAVDSAVFHPAVTDDEHRRRAELRASFGVDKDEPLAVVTSRLHPDKGIDRAIVAARAAKVRLVIAGDGPDDARLRALAGGDATFVGRRLQAEVADLLRAADLFFFCASPTEGSPLAVLEAAACGLALVALAPPPGNPGTRYIRDSGGVVVADPTEIADWLPGSDLLAGRAGSLALARRHSPDAWLAKHRTVLAR